MLRQSANRIDPKRRNTIDYKKKQFAEANYKEQVYPYRLSFYELPPTAEIKLEQFEQWAVDRLKVLAELEACSYRNKSSAETATHMKPILDKYLPLSKNSSSVDGSQSEKLKLERQKDHYSHFILRLAFSTTEDLRRRFSRIETSLFRLRFQDDDSRHSDSKERQEFVETLDFDWEVVGEVEKKELSEQLQAATYGLKGQELEQSGWFKVDWQSVPELVENRKVLVKKGMAYVPAREQMSMVLGEFTARLDKSLELTSRAFRRLDEGDRLTPILEHLAKSFSAPDSTLSDADTALPGAPINAASIDGLSQHFPLCMRNLHLTLRKNSHLRHFGRLQYTLFLKGIGLSMEDCLVFWRHSFRLITDDTFNKEYRYNIRHTYGDVGGDANRRGRGYSPFSCQKILTDSPPGTGDSHGCPYRHFSVDNLTTLLQHTGVNDRELLKGVKEDVEKKRYHIACNRVFDWTHRDEIKKAKEAGTYGAGDAETIVHPNTYFRKSYLLKQGGALGDGKSNGDVMDTS